MGRDSADDGFKKTHWLKGRVTHCGKKTRFSGWYKSDQGYEQADRWSDMTCKICAAAARKATT